MLREFAFDAFSSSVMGLFNRTFTRMGCKVHFFSWRTERLRNLGNFLSISNTLAFLSVKSTIFSTSDAKFRAQVEVGIFRAFHAFSVFLNRRVLGAGNTFSAEFVVNSIIRAHHALLFSWIPESWLFTIDALISSIIGSCGRALTEFEGTENLVIGTYYWGLSARLTWFVVNEITRTCRTFLFSFIPESRP